MSSRRNRRVNKKNNKKIVDETKIVDEVMNEEKNILLEEIHTDQDANLENREFYSDKIFRISYDCVIYICNITYKTLKFIFKISGIYLLWICLHYIASHLYVKFCVPSTIIGFIMSPFMTATPHCLGLRWIVYNAANMINNMWLIFGAWICSTILIINHDKTSEATSS
jgi:putative effector of murein hydrolase LrgA (UPF0299 family)